MKVTAINFTKDNLEKLPFPTEGRKLYKDIQTKHLFLFVNQFSKAFYYYAKYKGKPYQMQIGTLPAMTNIKAREKVRAIDVDFANGVTPNDKKRQEQKEMTLKVLFELYITERRQNKNLEQDKKNFNRCVAALHNTKVKEIDSNDIKTLHKNLSKTPYLANRIIELLRAVFNFAIREKNLNILNPCLNIKKNKEYVRERILGRGELRKYLDTCDKWQKIPAKSLYADIFQLLLLTGQRKRNVLEIRFEDIDFMRHVWTIRPEETKTQEPYTVPLVPKAIEILQKRHKAVKNSVYVFPSSICQGKPIFEIRRQWDNFLRDAEIEDVTRHDLRRTAGSIVLMQTKNPKIVQKFMCHKNIATTMKTYAHIWDDVFTDAVENAFDSINNLQIEGGKAR